MFQCIIINEILIGHILRLEVLHLSLHIRLIIRFSR